MKNRAIVITSIGRDKQLELCLSTVKPYAERVGADVRVIDTAKYKIKPKSNEYNFLTFEKFQVFDLFFGNYDRILRLDCDTLVSPSAPDVFERTKNHAFSAVMEDVRSRTLPRRKEIRRLSKVYNLNGWDKNYFNSGVVVASREAWNVFALDTSVIRDKADQLGPFKEQSHLNVLVQRSTIEPYSLNPLWNRMSMFDNIPKKNAYILHYAGPDYDKQIQAMKKDMEKLGW